jgi:DNA-binding winged helix-turn-helix (wHTH) protein
MRALVQEVDIGSFQVDLTHGRIQRDGVEVILRPQAFRVFKTLIQNRGQYVDYEHMISEAWGGTVVSRHTVDVTISEVRKALHEFSSWIAHRPKLGYKLEVPRSESLVRKGWHFSNRRNREGFEKAIASFQAAAFEDGSDFRAYEGLALSYLMLGTYGMSPPREMYRHFLDAHSRAVVLGGLTPELRTHRAHGLHIFELKFAEAEADFLEALREKPTLTRSYGYLAMLYIAMGRTDDALRVLALGEKVDPLWPVLPATEVSVRFFSRDFEAAATCGKKAVELHPYIQVGRCLYAQAMEYSGRFEEALREYRIAFMISGVNWHRILEAACLARSGKQNESRQILAEIEQLRGSEYVDAYYLALLYDALGMRDRAFLELQRACDEGSTTLCLLAVDPKMDPLRSDPRFASLCEYTKQQSCRWIRD